ncbi:MAG: Wzt carbohydrate-binding domain-containing protein [Candidatus Omnitrophica bacterium]|nr:Wzt carbohydrate-binding domain-containing protein [Candidatus Omnitrophota bacterium]
MRKIGLSQDVVEEYIAESRKRLFPGQKAEIGEKPPEAEAPKPRTQGVNILRVMLNNETDQKKWHFKSGNPLDITVTFSAEKEIEDPIMGGAIFRDDGVYVFGPNTMCDNCLKGRYKGTYTYTLHLHKLTLLRGKYYLTFCIFDKNHIMHYVWLDKQFLFEVSDDTEYDGLVNIDHSWSMREGW